MKKGILLVNLGTPDSPSVPDVRRYLDEFLMDGRVIDIKPIQRFFLVKGVIVPFRAPKSAKIYKEVWTEEGSALLIYGLENKRLLQESLGDEYVVAFGMRYQNPSIQSALDELRAQKVKSIQVIPLFPQYASASTGSVHQKVMEIVSKWLVIPDISFISSFHNHPDMIQIFADHGRKHGIENYDHILFSFHGLPQRQLIKADDSKTHCLQDKSCCQTYNDKNYFCYSAQSYDTAKLIAENLGLTRDQYTISFQSRLGKEPWLVPSTSETIHEKALEGKKRLLVFCPAFVADCLETLYEITIEYHEEFVAAGGEKVQLVESLNNDPRWIEVLKGFIVKEENKALIPS